MLTFIKVQTRVLDVEGKQITRTLRKVLRGEEAAVLDKVIASSGKLKSYRVVEGVEEESRTVHKEAGESQGALAEVVASQGEV